MMKVAARDNSTLSSKGFMIAKFHHRTIFTLGKDNNEMWKKPGKNQPYLVPINISHRIELGLSN